MGVRGQRPAYIAWRRVEVSYNSIVLPSRVDRLPPSYTYLVEMKKKNTILLGNIKIRTKGG